MTKVNVDAIERSQSELKVENVMSSQMFNEMMQKMSQNKADSDVFAVLTDKTADLNQKKQEKESLYNKLNQMNIALKGKDLSSSEKVLQESGVADMLKQNSRKKMLLTQKIAQRTEMESASNPVQKGWLVVKHSVQNVGTQMGSFSKLSPIEMLEAAKAEGELHTENLKLNQQYLQKEAEIANSEAVDLAKTALNMEIFLDKLQTVVNNIKSQEQKIGEGVVEKNALLKQAKETGNDKQAAIYQEEAIEYNNKLIKIQADLKNIEQLQHRANDYFVAVTHRASNQKNIADVAKMTESNVATALATTTEDVNNLLTLLQSEVLILGSNEAINKQQEFGSKIADASVNVSHQILALTNKNAEQSKEFYQKQEQVNAVLNKNQSKLQETLEKINAENQNRAEKNAKIAKQSMNDMRVIIAEAESEK